MFLRTNITITDDKKLKFEMKEHLQESIDIFTRLDGKEIIKTVTSPTRHKLREVSENCKKLSDEKREGLHSIVTDLLWIRKRARPYLETDIDFYVDKSDEDDWRKLCRIIAYVKSTIHDCRMIRATDLTKVFTLLDRGAHI